MQDILPVPYAPSYEVYPKSFLTSDRGPSTGIVGSSVLTLYSVDSPTRGSQFNSYQADVKKQLVNRQMLQVSTVDSARTVAIAEAIQANQPSSHHYPFLHVVSRFRIPVLKP